MTVKEVVRSFQQSVNTLFDDIYRETEKRKNDTEHTQVYYARKIIKKWFESYGV